MVTVVIPLYNKVRYIKRALDSVLAQTHRDFEVIVVNDGSTDGSERIVEQYTDPRIRLVNQANAGECAARNRGIGESRADLIAFLDADDEWLPEFLVTILCLANHYPDCGIYATGKIIRMQDGHELKLKYPGIPDVPWEGVISNYFLARKSQPVNSSNCAVPKRVLEHVGYFPVGERHGGDLDTWCRIALKYRVALSTCPRAVMYCNTDNSVSASIATPIYTAIIGTLDGALRDGSLPGWVAYKDVLDYRNYLVMVAARAGLVNLRGYAATAREMLKSTWATRGLRAAAALWYLLSFLPSSVVSALWIAAVASGRFTKRVLGVSR